MDSKTLLILLLLLVSTNSSRLTFKEVPGLFRKLSMENKDKICEKGFKNYTAPKETSVEQYTTKHGLKEHSGVKAVTGAVFESSFTGFSEVIKDVIPYFLFIVLAILAFLTWPIFILCFFCGCCCFDKNVKAGCCGLVFYIIAMSFMAGLIISGIVGYVKASNFVQSFDGSLCSLINFFDHFVEGDEATTLPKWIGASNLNKAFVEIKSPITTIKNANFDEIKEEDLKKSKETYRSALNDAETKGKAIKITFGGVEITDTKFAEEYNEKNTQGFMVQAEAENKVYIEGPTDYLPEIKKAGAELKKVDDLGTQLDKIAAQAATMTDSLNNSADKILGGFMSMKDTAENMILLAFKILYGIFIVIAVILMAILTLYVLINCFLFKIPLHVMWNIALLICILNFFLGAILGIFGYVTSIIAPTIAYFISPEFLSNSNSPINAPSPIPECINTCLNGDGNIYKVFGVENMLKNTKEFNEVMTIAAKIVNTADELNNYKSSAEKYEKRLEGYEKDLTTLTVGSKNGDLTALLEKANKNSKNNKYVLNEKECPSSKAETDCTDSVGNKCFLIENCKTSSDNEVKKIAEYVASLKEALTKEKQSITSLKGSFETAIGTVKTPINSAKTTVNELVTLINKYMSGDADLIQMFNCGFLGKDLIVFMDQLYFKFSGSCKGMAIACGVGAVLSYFGAIMVLRAVYRNGPKAKENSKKSGHKKLDNHEHDHEHDKEATRQLDTETFHIMPKPKQ